MKTAGEKQVQNIFITFTLTYLIYTNLTYLFVSYHGSNREHPNVLSRVGVTHDEYNGFWIEFIGTSITITLNYNHL